jgi:hypothetical protein
MTLSLAPALALALLAVVLIGGLLLVPLGLPGLWIMLGAALLYSVLVPMSGVGADHAGRRGARFWAG